MNLHYGDDPLLTCIVGYGVLSVLGCVVSLPVQAIRLHVEVGEEVRVLLVHESLEILIFQPNAAAAF